MYYAQIDLATGVCFAETELHSATDAPDMIPIPSMDGSRLGRVHAGGVFTAPPPKPTPPDPCAWLIDIGPFFDRFGAAKLAVLTSADPGVKAIVTDVSIRKWLDLKRSEVSQSLAYIGSKVPAVDAALQSTILTAPVAAVENLALRKLYF